MKYAFIIGTLLIGSTLFTSCRKAGSGGRAGINVHVIDDNQNVPYALIKLKYNATGFPGGGENYDEVDTADYAGKTSFMNLRKGAYYVYVVADDSAGTVLEGGAKVKIENRIGEQHVVVDLAEADPF